MKQHTYEFAYEVYDDITQLNPADAALLEQARAVTAKAYAPYSRFNVGAAALLANGEILLGTNQENASYPVGICAERVLLGTAATLHPDIAITSMAISFNTAKEKSNHPISPCGMCRQVMAEFAGPDLPVRSRNLKGEEASYSLRELLPHAFTRDFL